MSCACRMTCIPGCDLSCWLCPLQAQYNAPIADLGQEGIPPYRVRVACEYLSDPNLSNSSLLGNMTSALAVFSANTTTSQGCLDITGAPSEPEPEAPGTAEPPSAVDSYQVSGAAPEASPSQHEEEEHRGTSPTPAAPEAEAEGLSADDKFGYQVSHSIADTRQSTTD